MPDLVLKQAIDNKTPSDGVKVSSGLVREQEFWGGDEGAGNRHALLLPPGQLPRIMG
jgi:hypothetical protein